MKSRLSSALLAMAFVVGILAVASPTAEAQWRNNDDSRYRNGAYNQEFNQELRNDLNARNRSLPDFKRVGGYVIWDKDFPRTASMKIKRTELAEEVRNRLQRSAVVGL